jgi:hypothetical protein
MAYFVIKNITNKLDKRHPNVNQSLDIEYFSQFEKKFHKLASGREMVINADNLPLGVHILKAKNLIIVKKISDSEYEKLQQSKQIKEKKPEVTTTQSQVEDNQPKKEKKKFKKSEEKQEEIE